MSNPNQYSPKLSVQPILDYLAVRGGLRAYFPKDEKRYTAAGGTDGWGGIVEDEDGMRFSEKVAVEFRPIYNRHQRVLERARKAGGQITVAAADTLCCEVLKVHPFFVYGDQWFAVDTDDTELEVAA